MANYKVTFTIEAARLSSAQKQVKKHFPDAQVEKQEVKTSRADRLSEAESMLEDAKSIVEELKEEMEQWRESIPENLQSGGKYAEVEECEDELTSIIDSIENVEFGSVNFPSMF